MKGTPNGIEVVIVPASTLIESGVMFASSPLVRGDVSTLIAQVISFDANGSYSGLSYRHPTSDELNPPKSE